MSGSTNDESAEVERKLRRLAHKMGIETAYRDAEGVEQRADPATLRSLIDVLATRPPVARVRRRGRSTAHAQAWQPDFAQRGEKQWVLAMQLYSLDTPDNWSHGDFGDLMRLIDVVAACGGGGIGLNPLHALLEADDASPYAPSSRLFLNPLYIDMAAVPGLDAHEARRPASLDAQGALLDRAAVASAKHQALQLAYARVIGGQEADAWRDFVAYRQRRGPALRRHAAFCLLRHRFAGKPWRDWPAPWRSPDDADIAKLAAEQPDELGFQEFVQFLAETQLERCQRHAKARGMAVGLYLDLAVGVHPDGFDAWNEQAAYLQGATIGAPPDALNRAGQNWGLTAFNPAELQHSGYAAFRDMLAATMRHAGAIRIDHILGLNRLYLVPPGSDAAHGAYVAMPLDDMLGVVAQESQRQRCLVIGEDLGTVPEGLRAKLQHYGIWTYRVVMFEHGATGFHAAGDYPQRALVTFATHDLPTFAGWLAGDDIALMRRLDLPAPESEAVRRRKRADLEAALAGDADYAGLLRFLARTPSLLMAIALEDVLGSAVQVNVPGTFREYPNWRHRLRLDLPALQQRLAALAASFA